MSWGARQVLRLSLLFFCLLFSLSAPARTLVVISEADALYYRFVSALGGAAEAAGEIRVRTAREQRRREQLGAFDALVVVGVEAARAVARYRQSGQFSVLYTMIPRRTYEWLAREELLFPPARRQVIYLDQPPQRYLALCRALLGADARIGVLYSEQSQAMAQDLARRAASTGLQLVLEAVAEGERVVPRFKALLGRSDALLVLPDTRLYNERTIKAVLLNAFRADKPLLSYSASLVRAGALAALVSGPEEMGRQAGEILTCSGAKCDTVAVEQHWPRYFDLIVNRAIARRIGIDVPLEADLLTQIIKDGTDGRR